MKPQIRVVPLADLILDESNANKHTKRGKSLLAKSTECMARPILNHEGDVYDPFLGSGTTMCAAQLLDRTCYGMEIEPKYVAVAIERLADMGLTPQLIPANRNKNSNAIQEGSKRKSGQEVQGRPVGKPKRAAA